MSCIYYYIMCSFLLFINTNSILIVPKKLCKDCKFFIANEKRCALFGEEDLVTGEKDYQYANVMRMYDSDCGKNAKYFEINKYKFFTVPYYFILEYGTIFLTIIPFIFILCKCCVFL